MKLRAPAYPLITIDPYMSVWSMGDRLNAGTVRHWTGRDMPLDGLADIDGETYVFMGDAGRHHHAAVRSGAGGSRQGRG